MFKFHIFKIIFLLCLLHFPSGINSEENEVQSTSQDAISSTLYPSESPSEVVTSEPPSSAAVTSEPPSSSAVTSEPPTTEQPTVHPQPITTNICNMSVITSKENENAIYKKCVCDAFNGNVDCSNLGITELPKLISFPKSIHVANLRDNRISNLNADTFYNAREIIDLDLSHNEINFISISAFEAFKKLMRLDMSHNKVWNLPPNMFKGLGNLKRLDLSYNDLLNVFPASLAELKDLRELILQHNPLQELEPKHFEHLSRLERLDLESTLLKVIPDHVFVFTPELRYLKLAGNYLEQVPTEALHVLSKLKTLDLSDNPIEKIHEQAFHTLSGLVTLYLDRMPTLSYIENYAFGDMIQLQELHCSYNYKLSAISKYAFVKKSNNQKVPLVQLFLRQNELTTIPENLLNWNTGLELHLRDNPLNCDCHMEWLVNLNLKNNFQKHSRCSKPAELAGMFLDDLKGHELACGLQLADVVLIICGIFSGLLILALIVSFIIWRRNYRGYTKPGFYVVKNRHVNDIDYTGGDDSF